jgi:hypothetical protein
MASKFAVLIASGRFSDHNLPRLSAPLDDVTSFRDVLMEPAIGGFPRENVEILYDSNLSRARTEVEKLFKNKNNDDLVLLYYTGHGLKDEDGELYFALDGTELDSLDATSLDAGYIRKQMNKCASRRMVVILDCCHSGAFVARGGLAPKGVGSPAITRSTFETSGHGSYILTSSTGTQQSFEQKGQSLFTKYVVEGLRTGNAAPRKSNITINDIEQYVKGKLSDAGVQMRPTLISYTEGDPLTIAGNPNKREPIDQRIIDNIASKESKDVINQLGAISLLDFQFARLAGPEIDEAKSILESIGGDEERLALVRRAARGVLTRASVSTVKSLPVRGAIIVVTLAVILGGLGWRLVEFAAPTLSVEQAKKTLAADWKRDPDAVKKDADDLPRVLSDQAALNKRLGDAESKLQAAQRAVVETPSLAAAKTVVGADWKRDPDAVKKDADELPRILSDQVALKARLSDAENKLQAAQKAVVETPSLAVAKTVVGADWKRDPDAVKKDADELPRVLSDQAALNKRFGDAESKLQAAQKALTETPSLALAKTVVGADWKRDPDAVKKDADELPQVLSDQAALKTRLQDAESKLQTAQKALAETPSLAVAKAVVGAEWKRDPDAVKKDADELPQYIRQFAQLRSTGLEVNRGVFLLTLDNYDVRGSNLNGLHGDAIALDKCESACESTQQCMAYTYDKWNHICFLKSSVISLTFEPKATSRIRNSLALPQGAPTAFRMDRFRNKAFPGKAYSAEAEPSYGDCESSCVNDVRCVAVNFERATNLCNYFDSVGEYFSNDSMDAGAKEPMATAP